MENLFEYIAQYVALAIEAVAAGIITYGAGLAFVDVARHVRGYTTAPLSMRKAWLDFAIWLVLALEFLLAADIVRTAVSPSWTDIGQLAAIAGIRTFLNYFLERDIDKFADRDDLLISSPDFDRSPGLET